MNDILVIAEQNNYTLLTVDKKMCDIDYSHINKSLLARFIAKILWFFYSSLLYHMWPFHLRPIEKYKDIVLFECVYPIEIVKYIRKRNPNCRLYYWCWNTIDKIPDGKGYSLSKEIKKLTVLQDYYNVKVASFDIYDCIKYGMTYNNQLGVKLPTPNCENIQYDVFFCGIDKNRINLLRRLGNEFDKKNIKMKCCLLPSNNTKYSETDYAKYIIKKEMNYADVISMEIKSKCILDIVQPGQRGITWRPLEALFYRKKLITNYKNVKNYDFYRKENIFILGEDNMSIIKSFINSEYVEIPSHIVNKYQWAGWMKNLIGE